MRGPIESMLAAMIIGLIVVAIGAALLAGHSYGCERRWSMSGVSAKFGAFVGCMVETAPGVWTPERNVRLVEVVRYTTTEEPK